jgi:hypothetical protein
MPRSKISRETKDIMAVQGAKEKIHKAVTSWNYITSLPHRFGGTEYRLGKQREIGHVHGDELVDIPFPRKVRDELVTAGKAEPHHILPDSGWISFYLNKAEDIEQAIELFHLSYDIALKQQPHLAKVKSDKD